MQGVVRIDKRVKSDHKYHYVDQRPSGVSSGFGVLSQCASQAIAPRARAACFFGYFDHRRGCTLHCGVFSAPSRMILLLTFRATLLLC